MPAARVVILGAGLLRCLGTVSPLSPVERTLQRAEEHQIPPVSIEQLHGTIAEQIRMLGKLLQQHGIGNMRLRGIRIGTTLSEEPNYHACLLCQEIVPVGNDHTMG